MTVQSESLFSMERHLPITRFFLVTFALHACLVVAALILVRMQPATPLPSLPVDLIRLPQQELKHLPPLTRPLAPRPLPKAIPPPRTFGTGNAIRLPQTGPLPGKAGQAGQGKGTTAGPEGRSRPVGPLPFLTQNDIEELARKGMPAQQPGDDSVTLDTDEFKFISYNRWLKIKVESVLSYPELAAVSGYQGTLYIKFVILKNGSLGDVEVLQSSGYKILDDEALRAIRAAAPFQPLPDSWGMDRYPIRAAVIFYLGNGYIE